MKPLLLATLFLISFAVIAQTDDWEWEREVSNVKAKISVLENGETWVIIPDDNANMRYISQQLPAEYKKDGLAVTFNGWIGKIPPHVRMMGTPLKLTKIWVSCAEKKKFKLKKGTYTFK
ncbi:MAG: hypothetical protein KIS94_02875 [Chitinophagales bacterium]|nr:hypothetical protein [Chitinophagales bacterium]